MKNKFIRSVAAALLTVALSPLSSCVNELDQSPSYQANTETVYRDPAQIQQVLARLYATLAVSGQSGPSGQPDISGIDEGFSNYLRQYWGAQELTTDEAIIAWNDGNLPDYNRLAWNADNEFVRAMYDRIFYQVSLCNEFIRQTTTARLNERGISEENQATIRTYRAEARFLRALSYWHAIDMFGNVPFATEESTVGSTPPPQQSRKFVFDYIESELKAIDGELLAPKAVYARADKAAAWMLLSKLYLNAQVYTGQERNNDAAIYAAKVLDANAFALAPDYQSLFLADNDKTAARNEVIFPVTFDGQRTRTFGGMTFIVHAAVGGSMSPASFGLNGGWGGNRAKKNLVELFPGGATSTDDRALFYTAGQNLEINDIFTFTDGFAVTKFKNVTSNGVPGSDTEGNFPDTDFPMFRLADTYLMYAEAVLRGGAPVAGRTPLAAVNAVRTRANAEALASVDLDDILDERGRELYWEGHRRTDLIRFGKYTTASYVWPFKGGVKEGRGVEDFRVLFPIPTTDLVANPNLKQNTGY
ncbi:RagB/SusD family nutrient uptake outer membrane protein [Hymenobacter guriensis]|uniref:RagB/SusD family nutrient uptake outer membrane protein n=1 Tax=Hymenobacter guriensis TaxID=2793065 RepID=A0ABS0L436_9BACT|nr:RagB/SusD family nutrient uptake outer membrane protein [Hymenobacter guriensis]MBG8554905.1 RagB/SusD family nutrient uptake outer membrane protein [Hymenobacter guriensis]